MSIKPFDPDDRPLNLEQEQFVQAGRLPTCQPEPSGEAKAEIDFQAAQPCCCQDHRELHQANFHPWMQ